MMETVMIMMITMMIIIMMMMKVMIKMMMMINMMMFTRSGTVLVTGVEQKETDEAEILNETQHL